MDYRDLLMRYINHVGECEGITYLTDRHRTSWLSDKQWAELKRLDEESEDIKPALQQKAKSP